jgi:uncharacterized delta-60 repeat protein
LNGIDASSATNDALTWHNVRMNNAGPYRLIARNDIGDAQAIGNLTVVPAPTTPGCTDVNFYTLIGPDAAVYSAAVQPDGKTLIGGAFGAVDGVTRPRLARLNVNGSLDPEFVPALPPWAGVGALALQLDGRILVGGAPGSLERLMPDGAADTNFVSGLGSNIFTRAMALKPDGRILVSTSSGLRRLHSTGAVDSSFEVELDGDDGDGPAVRTLALQADGRLLIGGYFSKINDVPRTNVARLLSDGTVDMSFNAAVANQGVNAVALWPDGRIIIAGEFTTVNDVPRSRVARLHTDGSLDTTFDPGCGPNLGVNSVALSGAGSLLIAGWFTSVNQMSRGRVARLKHDGSLDMTFDPQGGGADQVVNVVLPLNDSLGRVLIAGRFQRVNRILRPYVAALYEIERAIQIRALPSSELELTWELGVLQEAADLAGPWTDVDGASSPLRKPVQASAHFFRLRLRTPLEASAW